VRSAAKPRELVGGRKRGRLAPLSARTIRVRPLDPVARCGASTSVEQLYRVDEQLDGRAHVHLVYFDQHGWYCFHGPACPAVTDVRRELRGGTAGGRRSPATGSHVGNGTTRARASGR
jgi:hypothetical protein